MSDFTSGFWSIAIIAVTLGGILGCMLLLWGAGKARVSPTGDNTTGHVWDGDLREMNNPLPRWWVWMFVITVVFSLVYLVLYPGLGDKPGTLNWSSVGEHAADVAKHKEVTAQVYAKYAGMPVPEIAKDPQARAIGERLFMNNCAQCHGSDARGSKGFPNLADGDWLWGGEPDKIAETIAKGRIGTMPPMAAAVGTPDDVRNVAHYVLSLSNGPHDSVRAALGKAKFTVCAACHGSNGKGNPLLGAPNLTDNIWLHGWGEEAIVAMVNNGKTNQMPAQEGKFSAEQIRVLASYVWGLSSR
ncbi:cytochrome-c oxidase, cbb3-type subunit III [Pseudorhodoferax sp. Leaf265]|jgi:cytochrome c oxidase cbb3-type subunit 3|uniref:cytochrome-c oxidase, cbb3-type subunit III n=1 Tax=Pseudorhodoferax sp. Leaf265 TaxID=1736315 RepID=UPI0007017846|nr:cytochrome-c oxidase, cbb3-type subunit III [Pseudorhodoferax sp. Leaf265]KQP02532.1 cytochrome oxidase subunit III [Pseudorhodoferax sp. Leaf265]